jgi:DNA-binding winged helix-turn-helix (wHTH) protein
MLLFISVLIVNRNHINDHNKRTLRRDETPLQQWEIGWNKFMLLSLLKTLKPEFISG